MKDVAGLIDKLSTEEIREITSSGAQGALTQAALSALDRAAGGPGMGRGYYVSAER